MPDMLWMKDSDGRYMGSTSPRPASSALRRHRSSAATITTCCRIAVADALRAYDLAAITAGAPCNNEEWLTFPDGHRN